MIERINEGQKVQAEIVHILYQDQIKNLKRQNNWWVCCATCTVGSVSKDTSLLWMLSRFHTLAGFP